MKHSSIWFALILILLASLPNAVKSEPVKPSPESANAPKSESTQIAQQTNNAEAPEAESHQSPSAPLQMQTSDLDQGQDHGDRSAQREATYTGLLVIVGVAAIVIAVLTYCAARNAAEAARAQAKAAELALKSDRPYLILDRAQLTGVLRGDDPVFKEPPDLGELTLPPRFSPRFVMMFHNYGKGPVIFREGFIRIDAVRELPPPRDFSACERMNLHANAVGAGEPWHPLAQFNFDADWSSLFPDVATGSRRLIAYGCIRYTDLIEKETYETGFCWIFIPPRTELHTMPKGVRELLAPYRAPGAPDPEAPIASRMPGDFLRGPASHNYNT